MPRLFPILFALLVLFPSFIFAESILVSAQRNTFFYIPSPLEDSTPGAVHVNTEYGSGIINPQIQAQYHYDLTAVDADGKDIGPISCGASLPTDATIRVKVPQPTGDDVQWFNTGGAWDTPYGDVVANAAQNGNMCVPKNYIATHCCDATYYGYASFSMAPPSPSVTGTGNFSCTKNDSATYTCKPSAVLGSGNISVLYPQTFGYFYGGLYYLYEPHGGLSGGCYHNSLATEVLDYDFVNWNRANDGYFGAQSPTYLPAGSANCPITVVAATPKAPAPPIISTVAGQCIVGSAFAIRLSGSSPTAKNIRYGVDWANTGVVTQYAPASGFAPSGSQQTASRTFSTKGFKTVRARIEEENGTVSGWATLKFACNTATEANQFRFGDFSNGSGGGASSPAISIRAVPALVRGGSTTRVIWTAENVTSCSVSGTNGDKWTNENNSPTEGEVSGPIKARTVFTLNCTSPSGTISADTTVNIIPTFEER